MGKRCRQVGEIRSTDAGSLWPYPFTSACTELLLTLSLNVKSNPLFPCPWDHGRIILDKFLDPHSSRLTQDSSTVMLIYILLVVAISSHLISSHIK